MVSFDNIDHELLMRAVRKHAKEPWAVLYIHRWLTAPAQDEEGRVTERGKGTPQGGVVSPILANLFLHYAFDVWMRRNYPQTPFERYADDAIVHCRTEAEAQKVRTAIATRMEECRLELHPEKTKVVYCKDGNKRRRYPIEKFDFLGYVFQPRRAKSRAGKYFVGFSPAISDQAARRFVMRFEAGSCIYAVTSQSRVCRESSIRLSGVGCNTTGNFIARR